VVPEAQDYLLTRLDLRRLPYALVTEETCDVGEFAGRCRSGDSNDVLSGLFKGVVERSAVVQRRHPLDLMLDRSEL
jgi:hypothetical protein